MAEVLRTDTQYLHEPITRLLQVRGKRLRPSLVIAAALTSGGEVTDDIVAGCVAVELVHISSLVHDDIIDEATTRWNIPTVSNREGSSAAILVGDYLQAKACAHAATISAEAATVAAETIAALCQGQGTELTHQHDSGRSVSSYLAAVDGKTASLFAAACKIGGLCNNLPRDRITALAKYGESFGMAFQLVDDVLDFLSTVELSGKPVGNDVREGVYTMPLLLALENDSAKAVQTLLKKQAIPELIETMFRDDSFSKTLAAAENYNQQAEMALENLTPNEAFAGLKKLPRAYTTWALENLANPVYRGILPKFM